MTVNATKALLEDIKLLACTHCLATVESRLLVHAAAPLRKCVWHNPSLEAFKALCTFSITHSSKTDKTVYLSVHRLDCHAEAMQNTEALLKLLCCVVSVFSLFKTNA